MKKILVTGGAGFIGSHLCEKLLTKDNKVICVDNFITGKKENIQHLIKNPNFEIINHNIAFLPLNNIYHIDNIDEIYNLACPASPKWYHKDPIETMKTSVLGVINMLDLAKRNKAKFLQASTSEIYGDPEISPQKESYHGNINCIGPRSCYDEGKRAAETIIMDYHRQYNLDTRIVRIFNTYGDKMAIDDGRVVSNFIVQALQNKNITIYGDGSQTRSFQYIDDLINGIEKLMISDYHYPVNIGNPQEITIKELAEKILSKISSESKLVYHLLPEDDPKQRKPDISLAKSLFNYNPKTDISVGLDKTIDYFKSIL